MNFPPVLQLDSFRPTGVGGKRCNDERYLIRTQQFGTNECLASAGVGRYECSSCSTLFNLAN